MYNCFITATPLQYYRSTGFIDHLVSPHRHLQMAQHVDLQINHTCNFSTLQSAASEFNCIKIPHSNRVQITKWHYKTNKWQKWVSQRKPAKPKYHISSIHAPLLSLMTRHHTVVTPETGIIIDLIRVKERTDEPKVSISMAPSDPRVWGF